MFDNNDFDDNVTKVLQKNKFDIKNKNNIPQDIFIKMLFQALFMSMINRNNTDMSYPSYNNNSSLSADKLKLNQDMNGHIEALQVMIDKIPRHTATIPVATVPIIVTVLETPPVCSTVSDIECCSTPMEPILSVNTITALELPQSFEAMIDVPVRTTVSQCDVTPPFRSNHTFEAISLDDKPNMDADEHNDKESVGFIDINGQKTNSTHQPEQPWSIFSSDNSNSTSSQVPSDNSPRIDIDVSYESKQVDPNNFNNQRATMKVIETICYGGQYTGKTRDEATLYSDCGTTVHTPIPPIPMVLIY